MSEIRQYPEGNCIAIYPDGEDAFVACLGEACCEWTVIGHETKRFIQVFPPNMKHPITITTQIEAIEQRREHIRSAYDDWLENYLKSRKKEKIRPSTSAMREVEKMSLKIASHQTLILEISIPEDLDDALKFLDVLIGCLDELNIIMKKTERELQSSDWSKGKNPNCLTVGEIRKLKGLDSEFNRKCEVR